jgi:hypothetical protein
LVVFIAVVALLTSFCQARSARDGGDQGSAPVRSEKTGDLYEQAQREEAPEYTIGFAHRQGPEHYSIGVITKPTNDKARLGAMPEQKVEAVRELVGKKGDVGMVGDGINDAPALAASSVGFAMGAAGTDVALEIADVALMQDDLRKLAAAVRLSRAAERIVKQNILASILFKGVFVLLAPLGLVTLWLAVLADMGTSIAVTLNGLRLFDRKRT